MKVLDDSSLRVERSGTTQSQGLGLLHYAGASFAMTTLQSDLILRLKSQAHSPSSMKRTKKIFSPFQWTFAISPEIDFRAIFWFGEE